MKIKLKRCLALLLILVTCFCILDNIYIGSNFFARLIMPEAHAKEGVSHYYDDSDAEAEQVDHSAFTSKMIDIAKGIAADTYKFNSEQESAPEYTYKWGGNGEEATSLSGKKYRVFDCRGFVAGSIRKAAEELEKPENGGNKEYVDLKGFYIGSTQTEYDDFQATGKFGRHKLTTETELQDGDILWRTSHTELFFWQDGKPMQVGACQTSNDFYIENDSNKGTGSCDPKDSIIAKDFQGVGEWTAYFRIGTTTTFPQQSYILDPAEEDSGYLGKKSREYEGEVDSKAELDEQIFDFQGNPQAMAYEGEKEYSFWLFTLLSQFLDFITGLLVSLLINPIMQILNAIVNFLTNFINFISGLPTGS